jgi:hypothetical protein
MHQQALLGYEKTLGADNTTTYIPALNTIWSLGFLFERQADSAKAKIMYSKALLGFEKVVGPNHPSSRNLRDNLQVLNTVTKTEPLENIEEPVNNSWEEILYPSARKTLSKMKRQKLFKKLSLR